MRHEPTGQGLYHYEFLNRSGGRLAFRWDDAGVIHVISIPGRPIVSTRRGRLPPQIRDTVIAVGGKEAEGLKVRRRACAAAAGQWPDSQEASFRFRGTVVGGDGRTWHVDFSVESRRVGDEVRFRVSAKLNPGQRKVTLEWEAGPNLPAVVVHELSADGSASWHRQKGMGRAIVRRVVVTLRDTDGNLLARLTPGVTTWGPR
ncbi:MAG: hypothetical protein N0A24_07130 [Armatimonadetes bacterium]|nr:hypothetical protein [Armatimonadota bacterium]MDW8153974.1 hypothetical protein [Armatimonadota bacterium]